MNIKLEGCSSPVQNLRRFLSPTASLKLFLILWIGMFIAACSGAATPNRPAEVPDITSPLPSLTAVTQFASDLPFDEFLETSYLTLLTRDPELVTELGLTQALGTPNDVLTDISDAYIRETQELETETLAALRSYDREALTPSQQLSWGF